jgi:hypothetical protein
MRNTSVVMVCRLIAWGMLVCPVFAVSESPVEVAKRLGVRGGLVVQVGCAGVALPGGVRGHGAFVVHGLDGDPEIVERARKDVKAAGVYGPVSVDRLRGRDLPYAENMVNLLIAESLGNVSTAEVMRVLVPNGVAYLKQNGKWMRTVKPWPAEMGNWSHGLCHPNNNPVVNDTALAPHNSVKWEGRPKFARHHDTLGSVGVMVANNGRPFYIVNERCATSGSCHPSAYARGEAGMLDAQESIGGEITLATGRATEPRPRQRKRTEDADQRLCANAVAGHVLPA